MSSRIEMTGGGGVSLVATIKEYAVCHPTLLYALTCIQAKTSGMEGTRLGWGAAKEVVADEAL